jgi:hypothetical protein
VASCDSGSEYLVDSGGNSRQWWPMVKGVGSTVVDSSGQWRQ